jgi:alkylation response protein AidB-like acyl-CoA dehydrogenase
MMDAGGPAALRGPGADETVAENGGDPITARLGLRYGNFRKTSIYAGSNEIQRNIMAKMMLGL